MSKKKNNKLSTGNYRILSNNWFVTLSATLVGVFVALYLNELVASQKLDSAKENATSNILTEMDSNLSLMQDAVRTHQKVFDVLNLMSYQDSESGDLILPFDTIMKFRREYPNLLIVKDSLMVEEGVYAYSNGGINFDFQLPQFELSTVAWNTLINTGLSRNYGFDCLLILQGIYKSTEKVISLNQELFDTFYRTEDLKAESGKILRLLAMLLDFERTAIQTLENGKKEIKNCS